MAIKLLTSCLRNSGIDFLCSYPISQQTKPANKEVRSPDYRYFRCGDVVDLKDKMEMLLGKGLSKEEAQRMRKQITEKYNPS